MSGAPTPDPPTTAFGRLRRLLAVEDIVLSVVLLAAPILLGGGANAESTATRDVDVIGGLVYIAAVIGAIVCLATRVPGESILESADHPEARFAVFGPLVGAVGFVGGDGVRKLGLEGGEFFMGLTFIVAVGAFVFADRLPVIRRNVRRALVAPFVLVAASIFERIVGDITRGLDISGITSVPAEELGLVAFAAAIFILGAAVFYAMLVVAPRTLAEPGAPARAWLLRFALFIASTLVGLVLAPAS